MSNSPVVLYVDGACKGNPGLGGWGVHIQHVDGTTEDWCGGEKHTTNNRMELMAAIEGLRHTTQATSVVVWTDSSYVQKGISEWIHGWKKKNWRKADGGAVINADLWQQLDQASQQRNVDWRWIKGHAGHAGNEQADQLANLGTEYAQRGVQGPQAVRPSHTSADIAVVVSRAVLVESVAHTPQRSKTDWLRNDPLGLDSMADDLPPDMADDIPSMDERQIMPAAPMYDDPHADVPFEDDDFSAHSSTDSSVHSSSHDYEPRGAAAQAVPSPAATPAALAPIKRATHGPRQLILDTETTGFDPIKGDRVIEIGVIEMVGRKLTGNSLHVYLNPQRAVGESERIHGLSDAFLADKPLFASIAQQLCDFIEGGEVIAHNASFDMNFLEAELRRCGAAPLAGRVQVTDTLAIAKRKHAGQKNSLDALVKRYDIKPRDRQYHGALLDAEILADVYLAMTGGQVTLDMDNKSHDSQNSGHRKLSPKRLSVVRAHADEHALHSAWLEQMERKAGQNSLWRDCGLD